MEVVNVSLGTRSYEIKAGPGLLETLGDELGTMGFSKKAAMITNPTVEALYGERAAGSLKEAGFDLRTIIVPDGEQYKDMLWASFILGEMLKHPLDRNSVLVALGGGVIGDIAGFAASTYMRGISFVQAPTTLLAQVDSSVGGKTGVNHRLGKNLIGSFWQPRLVLADTGTLQTLPVRELRAGLSEVIKYGVIWDPELFTFLRENRDRVLGLKEDAVIHIIKRSCEIKAEVVSRDEREAGLRAILNYGHTVGHALENRAGYGGRFLHGEALAVGMCVEAGLSRALGHLSDGDMDEIRALVSAYGLPAEVPGEFQPGELTELMRLDKKSVSGAMSFILPERIGSVRIEKDVPESAVADALVRSTVGK